MPVWSLDKLLYKEMKMTGTVLYTIKRVKQIKSMKYLFIRDYSSLQHLNVVQNFPQIQVGGIRSGYWWK